MSLDAAHARRVTPCLRDGKSTAHFVLFAFSAQPELGFKAMRIPFLRSLILKTYADGPPHTRLLTTLARLLT